MDVLTQHRKVELMDSDFFNGSDVKALFGLSLGIGALWLASKVFGGASAQPRRYPPRNYSRVPPPYTPRYYTPVPQMPTAPRYVRDAYGRAWVVTY
jgi:hypothetical protein